MTAALSCPDLECWQALFQDTIPADLRERCEHHLETCPLCQERLRREEEEAEMLHRLGRQFGDPTAAPCDPTLDQFLDWLRARKGQLRDSSEEAVDLYFLSSTDQPGLLGTLGHYEVEEVIGQGGMGVVVKAFDPLLQRTVAIKVLSPAVAGSSTARRRFTREAQAAAAVCHEHIVPVHGVYEAEGLPYLVMQYVAGESLQARLDRTGPLALAEVLCIGYQTASGLAAAHAQGLIHRDIKPANLLLEVGQAFQPDSSDVRLESLTYRVKITDFGLARLVDDIPLTQSGVVAGTPEYMAPEQAQGGPVDHRADLFSLGSVLYALCTGVPPFRGATGVAVLRQVSEQTPDPIRSLNPAIPVWLEALIDRLLAKDPDDRFQSAAEVASLLGAHLDQPETEPAPALKSLREPGWGMILAALAGAFLGLAALGFVRLLLVELRSPGQGSNAESSAGKAIAGKWDVWSVAFSPDGKIVAAGAGRWDSPGEVGIWDLPTQKPLQRFAEDLGVASVALSPDGKLLAWGTWAGQARILDWAAGKQIAAFPTGGVSRVAFSPDGKLLAAATEGATIQLWDLAAGKLLPELEGELCRFHCVAFSPDGHYLLAGGGDWKAGGVNQVNVWELAGKKQVGKLTGHQSAVLGISYSPDGKTLATSSADGTIRLWDAATHKPGKIFRSHRGGVENVIWTPDGKMLISAGWDHTIRFWDVERGQETDQIALKGEVRTVRLSPDGSTLFAGSVPRSLKLFAVASREELGALWQGPEAGLSAMDHLPALDPSQAPVKGRGSRVGFLSLGLAFVVSFSFAVGLALWRRGRVQSVETGAGPTGTLQSFSCSECGKPLKIKADLAGKKVKCPLCRQTTHAPENRAGDMAHLPVPSWLARADVLASFAISGVLAVLLLVLRPGPRESESPYVSKLQPLANRVRAKLMDTIDARNFSGVTDRDLPALRGLTNLKNLNLDHTEVTDEGLKEVVALTSLASLSLTNSQVTDAGLQQLKTLKNLEELRLDRLPISDASLAIIPALPRLRNLSLYQTGISDRGLVYLEGNTSLDRLSLDDTLIGDEGLRHLAGCTNLKILKVWKTRVTPAGIQELRKTLPTLDVRK